jgi:glycosyltransferase involved in cell wall biosynthesis
MNLAVCIPISWDYVPTPFVISLSQLFRPQQLRAIRELGIERFFYLFNRAFPLDLNRNTLVKKALEFDADWLLFLDADMTFPPDLVSGLLSAAAASGSAIVSGTYFKKLPPHPCVSALRLHPEDPQLLTPIDINGHGLQTRTTTRAPAHATDLVECDVIGLGAALIHREVFDATEAPWFEYEIYEKTGERTVTEDVPFCRKAQEAGFTILTDSRLLCGHVRQVEVGESDWLLYREAIKDQVAVTVSGEGE